MVGEVARMCVGTVRPTLAATLDNKHAGREANNGALAAGLVSRVK